MTLFFGSICSGIEAASVAWTPLGWRCAFVSEIEPFPAHVLAERHGAAGPAFMPGPEEAGLDDKNAAVRRNAIRAVAALPASGGNQLPNFGDLNKIEEWPDADIDVLVGGTPCQDYSIAGKRAGMAGARGGLTLKFVKCARRYSPDWMVWENVPGVLSSNGGRDFARFLGDLAGVTIEPPETGWKSGGLVAGIDDAYGLAWRVLDAQYVRTCDHPFAVPQRRRRVFVVGYLGDWRRAAAVLFDRESLSGNPPPRREKRQGVAPTIASRPTCGGGLGTDLDLDGGLIANSGDVGFCLTASAQNSLDAETETLVAHTLKAEGFDAGEDGTGRGTPIVPVKTGFQGDALEAVAFDMRGRDKVQATVWSIMPQNSGKDYKARSVDVAQPLMAGGPTGGNQGADYIQQSWAVRRLTPTECERLQGFPDGYTAIPWRGKPASDCPDGPRYKALGNSMAVNVMRWIGERIELVERTP